MINVQNVSVHYGDRTLFDEVSFTIGERDRVGLVGRNGAGKSTMMKIVAKQTNPDGGNVTRPSGSTIGYLHQDMALPKGKTVIEETLTALEEVGRMEKRMAELEREIETRTDYESDAYSDILHEYSDLHERFALLGGATAQAEAERILTGLGFKSSDMDRLTDEFSGGWQMRVELAKMLLSNPNYLLLDEPTNHLDIESILWLEVFLKTYSGAVVLISHDKAFLDAITMRTIEIELGNVYDYKGNYSKYIELRKERRELQQAAYENQQTKIEQMQKVIDRFKAKATKASMAQSMMKQLDKIERIEVDETDTSSMKIQFPPSPRSGEVVVEAVQLSKSYGSLSVLNEVDFQLVRGDRVAFVGQNGQGKTTLAKIIVAAEQSTGGVLQLGHNVAIGYYAQNQAENLPMNKTLLETMEMHSPPEMRTKLRNILGSFLFSGDDSGKKVSVLSGGERARLAMACLLLHPINLLVMDEPTNHLDMHSKDILKQALIQYDGTLIVVSHDRDFLQGLTTRTLEFRDRKLYNYIGDVQAFLEKRKLDGMRELGKRAVEKAKAKEELNPEQEKQKKELERKVKNLESKIAVLEKELKDFERKMAVDGFYEKPDAPKIIAKYNSLQQDLAAVTDEWEMAVMQMEG